MWSIINPPGSANRAHIHPGCTWSGVYYIQAPEGCGNIEFIDPRTENLMHQPRYVPNKKRPKHCWTKVNLTPEARPDADLPELALPRGRAEPQRGEQAARRSGSSSASTCRSRRSERGRRATSGKWENVMSGQYRRNELNAAFWSGGWLLGLAFVFSFFVTLLMLTSPMFMLLIYDRVLSSRSQETLVALFGLVVMLLVLMGLFDYSRGRILARFGARLQERLESRVLEAVEARASRTRSAGSPDQRHQGARRPARLLPLQLARRGARFHLGAGLPRRRLPVPSAARLGGGDRGCCCSSRWRGSARLFSSAPGGGCRRRLRRGRAGVAPDPGVAEDDPVPGDGGPGHRELAGGAQERRATCRSSSTTGSSGSRTTTRHLQAAVSGDDPGPRRPSRAGRPADGRRHGGVLRPAWAACSVRSSSS